MPHREVEQCVIDTLRYCDVTNRLSFLVRDARRVTTENLRRDLREEISETIAEYQEALNNLGKCGVSLEPGSRSAAALGQARKSVDQLFDQLGDPSVNREKISQDSFTARLALEEGTGVLLREMETNG